MMRQICKQILTILSWALACALLATAASADSLVTTIVTDPLSGVAIDGYDPVSYFTGPDPQEGSPDYEYDWGGVPWYFASAANRDVFMRAPEVYAPQYGGHCLMSLSRGYLSDGKARLYVIDALKLYFFYSAANREAFLMSRSEALQAAAKNWPELVKELSGPQGAVPASGSLADGSSAPSGDWTSASGSSSAASDGSGATAPSSVAPPSVGGNVGGNTDSASSETPHG
jgi:YHS domain-containing protein